MKVSRVSHGAVPRQVFLNLLAMFPLSPYAEARDEAGDSPETENYEALLSLAERLGEAKPRGLARHEIELLPSYKYSEQTHQGEWGGGLCTRSVRGKLGERSSFIR